MRNMTTNKRWIKHVHAVNVILGFVCRVHRMYQDVSAVVELKMNGELDFGLCGDIKLERYHVLLDEFYDMHALQSPDNLDVVYLQRLVVELGELLEMTVELRKQMEVLCSVREVDNVEILDELMVNIPDMLDLTETLIDNISVKMEGVKGSGLESDIKRVLKNLMDLNGSCEDLLKNVDDSMEKVDRKQQTVMCLSVLMQDLRVFEESLQEQIEYVNNFINVLNNEANLMINRLFGVPDFTETLLNLQRVVTDE